MSDAIVNTTMVPLKETVRIRRVIVGILPYVKITKTESGCKFGDKCLFGHIAVDSQPSKVQKSCGKDQLPC